MKGQTDGKSPHSTGLRPLPGPLPKKETIIMHIHFSPRSWLNVNLMYSILLRFPAQYDDDSDAPFSPTSTLELNSSFSSAKVSNL